MDPGFSPIQIRIWIRILKTRIRIRPSFAFNIFNNLMMLFDEILEDPNQKKIVLRVIKQIFLLVLLAFGGFFMYPDPDFPNPDFPNPIQIFLPNRIRTREKKSDLDPDKRTRIRNTATKQTGIPDERSEFAGKTVQLIQKLKKLANEDS